MSLYRQYRPQSFGDVAGQEHIVTTLMSAVEQDKLAHAYLFAGTRGTGKTSIARILAKILLTRGIEDETLRKQIIQGVEEGNLVDLTEIDAASNRGIDDIRSLLEKIQFTPVVARAKVYIVDEVHMLTREAFNALLKTLEEPPPYAYFILATTELHKIPLTIQSRCQRFLFKQIRPEHLIARLAFIAKKENITVDDEALAAIAHHVQGSLRDAISLLDQLRTLENITATEVRSRVGETGHEYVEQMFEAIDAADTARVLTVIQNMEEAGVPLENFTRLMLGETRERLHREITEGRDHERLLKLMDALLGAVKDIRIAPLPGLTLESHVLQLIARPSQPPIARNDDSPALRAATTKKIEEVKAHHEQTAKQEDPPAAKREEPSPDKPTSVSLEDVRKAWPAVIENAEPPFVRMSLKNGHVHSLEGSAVIIAFSSLFHRDKASAPEAGHGVEDALEKELGTRLSIRYVLETDLHSPSPLPNAENVSLAEAALEVF